MTAPQPPACRSGALALPPVLTLSLLLAAPVAEAQDKPEAAPIKVAPAEPAASSEEDQGRRKQLVRLAAGEPHYKEPTAQVYTLEALVERAMEVNPQVAARRYTQLYAEQREGEADWAMFPSIELGGRLTYVPNNPDFNAVQGNLEEYFALNIGPLFQTTVRVIFPITTFGKIDNLQELAALGVDQSELETAKLRLEIIRKVREAYLSVQLGELIEALSIDGSQVIRDEMSRMDEAREFGDEDVDVVELRKLQIYEAELGTREIDNERLIRLTHHALGTLVQLEPAAFAVTRFDEASPLQPLPTLAECLEIARGNRPDVALLEKATEARRIQLDLEIADFYPDIFFAIDSSFSLSTVDAPNQTGFVAATEDSAAIPIEVEPLNDPFNFNRFTFAFGFRLNINPVNQYWKISQARSKLDETAMLREAALQGIDLDVTRQWHEANDHRRKVELLERRLKAAERWRNQVAVAYEAGGSDFNDFITPLKSYYEARLLLIKARYDYLVAQAYLAEKLGVTQIGGIGSRNE